MHICDENEINVVTPAVGDDIRLEHSLSRDNRKSRGIKNLFVKLRPLYERLPKSGQPN